MTQPVATGPVVNTSQPFVSIVVPSYNGARYLRESLDSIVAQTYPRTEILLMDDASTDETEEIAASYGDAIAHHRHSRTLGQFENVNSGIARASGELVAVYHADDVYGPEIVEREVSYLTAHPEVGAVFCKQIFIDADGRPYGRLQLPEEIAGGRPLRYEEVLNGLLRNKNRFMSCPSSMVRASVYREVGGYDPRFRIESDLEMWLRIARRHCIGVIDQHLYGYRRGHGSLSEQVKARRAEPEGFFKILDLELAHGGRELADDEALAAYEAHRAEDQLRMAVANYVLGRTGDARAALDAARLRRIAAGERLTRTRLLVLAAIMHALVRLPQVPLAAKALDRRVFDARTPKPWPVGGPPKH